MKRDEVYKLVDGERSHQDKAADYNLSVEERSIASHLLMIDKALIEAKKDYASYDSKRKALESVRSIAALAVRCMELHDTPARNA